MLVCLKMAYVCHKAQGIATPCGGNVGKTTRMSNSLIWPRCLITTVNCRQTYFKHHRNQWPTSVPYEMAAVAYGFTATQRRSAPSFYSHSTDSTDSHGPPGLRRNMNSLPSISSGPNATEATSPCFLWKASPFGKVFEAQKAQICSEASQNLGSVSPLVTKIPNVKENTSRSVLGGSDAQTRSCTVSLDWPTRKSHILLSNKGRLLTDHLS